MKRLLFVVGVAFLLGACSTEPVTKVDTAKAADLNAQLGLRYMLMGRNDVAMEKLQHALTFDEDYPPAHHYLAELYRRLNKPEEADEHYKLALKGAPKDSALLNNYGAFLCGQKRFDEAEEYLLRVLDDPVYRDRNQVLENLGLCLQQKPDLERASNYIRKALEGNPRLPKSLLAMTDISHAMGHYLSARAYLQRYSEIAQLTPRALWLGIEIERNLGDRTAVKRYGDQLLAQYPNSDEARRFRELP